MYRIVLVDDEENTRNLMCDKINRADNLFEVVGVAENGVVALSLIESLQPDILITDICMPMMDGLALIKAVKALNRQIKTLVISGYDDFSYAKQAVGLGVKDYLLKPFVARELFEVLECVAKEIDEETMLSKNIASMQEELTKQKDTIKQGYLKKILTGQGNLEDLLEEGEQVGVSFKCQYYSVGVMRLWDEEGQLLKDASNEIFTTLLALIQENYFPDTMTTYTLIDEKQEFVFLIGGDAKHKLAFKEQLESGIVRMSESIEKYYGVKSNTLLGKIYTDSQSIAKSYREALVASKSLLGDEQTVMYYESYEIEKETIILERPTTYEKALLLAVQMGDYTQAMCALQQILTHYVPIFRFYPEFVGIGMIELVIHLSQVIPSQATHLTMWKDDVILQYLRQNFLEASLMETKIMLQAYIIKCCDQFERVGEKSSDRIIARMKQLIQSNLQEPLFTLDEVAQTLHFSPNYLRQLFKQKTGENFKDCLIRERMQKATYLMQTTPMKIQAIASEVGYVDQRYFARCFKKQFGCTPSAFKEHKR